MKMRDELFQRVFNVQDMVISLQFYVSLLSVVKGTGLYIQAAVDTYLYFQRLF
jgi:hypothetical protein